LFLVIWLLERDMSSIPNTPLDAEQIAHLRLLGDLTSSVTHEFNNILNNIMLHMAVLEQRGLSEELRAETAQVKQAGRQAATLIKQFQQYCQGTPVPSAPVDLNPLIESVRDEAAPKVALELAADLPPVLGTDVNLRRLAALLLANATAVSTPDRIVLRTERSGATVRLSVSDAGPTAAPELLARQFEPFVVVRPGTDGVRLTVCKMLARRMSGSIHGDNRPEGGMVYTVELRAADKR
jgi:two-component system C4-dicarboxylate transport sensor histidine kinase DctB